MELTIPLSQMIVFIVFISVCLLFSRYKLGLSVTFCFTFYWGFVHNKDLFFSDIEGSSPFLIIYIFSGIVLLLFALFSFMGEE